MLNIFSRFIFSVSLLLISFANAKADTWQVTKSISILNKKVHHQGINHLDINVKYTYKPSKKHISINDSLVTRQVDSLLISYPNTTDWWEIVNKNITGFFMATYPEVDSFASDILVHWTSGAGVDYGHRFPTRSITSRTRQGGLYEYFGFMTPMDSLYICLVDKKVYKIFIDLKYQYIRHIDDKDYPDGLETENYFKKLLQENSVSLKFWDDIIQKTQKDMLAKYNKLQNLKSDIIIYDAGGERFEAATYTGR
jgi:hypothetical protein